MAMRATSPEIWTSHAAGNFRSSGSRSGLCNQKSPEKTHIRLSTTARTTCGSSNLDIRSPEACMVMELSGAFTWQRPDFKFFSTSETENRGYHPALRAGRIVEFPIPQQSRESYRAAAHLCFTQNPRKKKEQFRCGTSMQFKLRRGRR